MGLKTCKFGGTSVADARKLQQVKAIVEADPERRFVVPSAPGKRSPDDVKVTDMLYACHQRGVAGEPADEVFEPIRERYLEIIRDLGLDFDLNPYLDEVCRQLSAGAGEDYAASRGEYLNGLLVAELLGYEFVDPADIIHFDAQGRFDADWTQDSVSKRLAGTSRAVVPGFYGALPDGSIKTFSRGGTDISGAIVARGTGSDVYENWTDVSGLLMADPRIVENPRTIEVLTYRELRELAYMGATVLHDEAIFPVRQAGIPVHIRNTDAGGDSRPHPQHRHPGSGRDANHPRDGRYATERTDHRYRGAQGLHHHRPREDPDERGDRLRSSLAGGARGSRHQLGAYPEWDRQSQRRDQGQRAGRQARDGDGGDTGGV
jgi:aspartate kinase